MNDAVPCTNTIIEKERAAHARLRAMGSVLVAFSGGVDSSLVCALAKSELGDKAEACILVSPLLPASEEMEARALAASLGIRLHTIQFSIEDAVRENPPDRCYWCKRAGFSKIIARAAQLGLDCVADGQNADDASDYRPGSKAARELGAASPLADAGFTKQDVRALAKKLGLSNWNKAAAACLASRIPYGETLEPALLRRIEQAENVLRQAGFEQCRVRCHKAGLKGGIARVELGRGERAKLYDENFADEISRTLKALGFTYVCVELEGYSTGSMNAEL